MSRTALVSELATKIRQRGDYENSEFITDAILIDFIDSAHTEVYDILVGKWEDYYTVEVTFNLESGSDSYSLPTDFYKLLGVDISVSGYWCAVKQYSLTERNTRQGGSGNPYNYRYRVQGSAIKIIPEASAASPMRMLYIPSAPVLAALTDSIDGVNGWEELVVLLALRRCQVREESSVTSTDKEIARQLMRIDVAADARDAGEAMSMEDSY